jgi:hypothetical protein
MLHRPAAADATPKKEKASRWARSTFSKSDLNKLRKVRLLSDTFNPDSGSRIAAPFP